jgi:hypothetical protein
MNRNQKLKVTKDVKASIKKNEEESLNSQKILTASVGLNGDTTFKLSCNESYNKMDIAKFLSEIELSMFISYFNSKEASVSTIKSRFDNFNTFLYIVKDSLLKGMFTYLNTLDIPTEEEKNEIMEAINKFTEVF